MTKNSDSNDYLTVRVGVELQTEFVRFCKEQRDMSPSQVIKMFIHYYNRTRDASFCFAVDDPQGGMSEKNESLAIWLSANTKKTFSELAVPNMSVLIRGYMRYCIANGIPSVVLSSDDVSLENRVILQEQVDRLHAIGDALSQCVADKQAVVRFVDELSNICEQLNVVIDNI